MARGTSNGVAEGDETTRTERTRQCPYSMRALCHSEHSEESIDLQIRYFTALRSVQYDKCARYSSPTLMQQRGSGCKAEGELRYRITCVILGGVFTPLRHYVTPPL